MRSRPGMSPVWGCPKCQGLPPRPDAHLHSKFCDVLHPWQKGSVPHGFLSHAYEREMRERKVYREVQKDGSESSYVVSGREASRRSVLSAGIPGR